MAKKKKEVKTKLNDDSKVFAFLAVFLTIIGFIIALLVKKEDKYVMFYAKQSLVLFIAYVVAAVVSIIPIIGWIVGPIAYVLVVVLWVIGWVYALSGEEKKVPIIGELGAKINL